MLVDAIRDLYARYPLEEHYDWSVPSTEDINLEIPADILGNYERNIWLKDNLQPVLQQDDHLHTHYWLIRKWGRINLQRTPENSVRIQNFIAQLPDDALPYDSYSRISSFSKIAAFLHPDQYSIYDSRVIYSLNWLIYKHEENRTLFPQPGSQNTAINGCHTQTLYGLEDRDVEFHPNPTAYHQYCELMLDLSREALDQDMPYYLEMLLFVIAPIWVPDDVADHTVVSINSDYP